MYFLWPHTALHRLQALATFPAQSLSTPPVLAHCWYVSPVWPQNNVTVLLHIFARRQVLSLPLPFRPFGVAAVACGFLRLVCTVVIMLCYYCYYYDYVAAEYVLLCLFYCCFVLNCHFWLLPACVYVWHVACGMQHARWALVVN